MQKKFFGNLIFLILLIFSYSQTVSAEPPDRFKIKIKSLGRVPEKFEVIENSIKFSADVKHISYAAYYNNTRNIIRLDDSTSPVYYAIKPGTPLFSPTGRHAFIGYKSKEGDAEAVIDGKPGPRFDNIDNFQFSPDGTRYTYRAIKKDLQCVVVDGRTGPWFKGIPVHNNFTFSPDSKHLAYVALKEESGCVLVLNGQEQEQAFNFITGVTFSPGGKRVAYKARTKRTQSGLEEWCVIVDGKQGQIYQQIFDLVFSIDSTRFAYAAVKNRQMTLVVDGIEQPYQRTYGLPVFSINSKHLAYVFTDKKGANFVLDGKGDPPVKQIFTFLFSLDSNRYAYTLLEEDGWHSMVDGKKGSAFQQIGAFKFSLDSKRCGYSAESKDGGLVVLDGKPGPAYLSVGEPYFSNDSKHSVYRARRKEDGKWGTVLNGKIQDRFYNAIGKYRFSEDNRHLVYNAMLNLGNPVMVIDGIEQCKGQELTILGDPHFSPDSNHVVYHAKEEEEKWHLVVDGHVLGETFGGFIRGTDIIFDSDHHFHTIGLRMPGPEFILIEVDIPKNLKIESEL